MGCARLKVYAPLGQAAGRVFDLDLPQPSPVADLLRTAAEKHGFTDQLFDESGHFKRSYTILLNGTSLYHLDGVNTLVRDGDEIAILAFVAGGATCA